jgi:hypothetical protein
MIGCVQHDCAHCAAVAAEIESLKAEVSKLKSPVQVAGYSVTCDRFHCGNLYWSKAAAENLMTELNRQFPAQLRTVEEVYSFRSAPTLSELSKTASSDDRLEDML